MRDSSMLIRHWKITKQILLADLKSGEWGKIKNALYTCIWLGVEEMVPELISLLNKTNEEKIGWIFLNCGNPKLRQAAEDWAKEFTYIVMAIPSGGAISVPVSWGAGTRR